MDARRTALRVRANTTLSMFKTLIAAGIAGLGFLGTPGAPAQSGSKDGVIARWDFSAVLEGYAVETVSGKRDAIEGTSYLTTGPVGPGVEFDGYTTAIRHGALEGLGPDKAFTVGCWLQLEAYPWNELPILDHADAQGALLFGVDAEGHLLASIGDGASIRRIVSSVTLPLRQWTLVSFVVGKDQHGTLYVNDQPVKASENVRAKVPAGATADVGADMIIGHVRRPLLPEPARMIHPHLRVEYSLQGSLSELTVYDRPLLPQDISELFRRGAKNMLQPMPWPKFPRWQGGPGRFGAFYTTLRFEPSWDRPRRVSPDSDVVVRFEHAPVQLVFWQGANYVPAWVTENNHWYTDEFMEVFGRPRCPDGEDCEPMSDKQVRYSHVRILENTPARAVIHWRYALSEVELYGIADAPSPTAWGDWADEYWTVYPDGVATRRQVLWSTVPERGQAEFQESIVLIPPGEMPEDSINFDALSFANLKGESRAYSWQKKTDQGLTLPQGPESFPLPVNAVIQWVNLKSTWKPFQVAWGDHVSFAAYNGEKSISSFEWWNHWPVAQIPSSGRPALAGDRAGHTSLSHIYWDVFEQDSQHIGKILMSGLTTLQANQLAPVAKSWRTPASLALSDGAQGRYDAAERAYIVSGVHTQAIRMNLHGGKETPIVNPAFVVEGWKGKAVVQVDGNPAATSQAKIGYVERLDQTTLVIFIPITADRDVSIELSSDLPIGPPKR